MIDGKIYVRVLQMTDDLSVLKPSDKVRINITSFPDNVKQDYVFPAKEKFSINHEWTLDNKWGRTCKFLITIRKKSFIESDPIIGQYTVKMDKIPVNEVVRSTLTLHVHGKNGNMDAGQLRLEIHNCQDESHPFSSTLSIRDDI